MICRKGCQPSIGKGSGISAAFWSCVYGGGKCRKMCCGGIFCRNNDESLMALSGKAYLAVYGGGKCR